MLGLLLVVTLTQLELPPEPTEAPAQPPVVAQNFAQRIVLESAGAIVGTGAALGISLAFTLSNTYLDARFANAALGALLMTGGAFAIHQLLGGRGEITLVLLTSIVTMAAGALIANVIDPTVPMAAILASAIAAVPGAALATISLEGTTPKARPPLHLAMTGNGFMVRF
jgi:hypothetical protein